jgi:peptidoglycan/xylan/chitin deacetylase (PgdA/CDA1 family)
VGLPGSAIGSGPHTVKLILSDGTEIKATFLPTPVEPYSRAQSNPPGRSLVVGYDDGNSNNPPQYRSVFAARGATVRPYFSVIAGKAGGVDSPGWSVWRGLQEAGCQIANHSYDHTSLNLYPSDAAARARNHACTSALRTRSSAGATETTTPSRSTVPAAVSPEPRASHPHCGSVQESTASGSAGPRRA